MVDAEGQVMRSWEGGGRGGADSGGGAAIFYAGRRGLLPFRVDPSKWVGVLRVSKGTGVEIRCKDQKGFIGSQVESKKSEEVLTVVISSEVRRSCPPPTTPPMRN